MSAAEAQRPPYRVQADSVEACNCQHGCNCQFVGYPNEGRCEFVVAWQVREGRVGNVSLDGVRVALAAKYPKAIHEGNGHVVLFIDDNATEEQADAVASILSGKMGGMPWEVLAGTVSRFEGPIRKPVEIQMEGERSRLRVPGSIDLALVPIRDAVSGEEKQVHIVYPRGGFLWNSGIFVWKPRTILGELHARKPDIHAVVCKIANAWGTSEWR